jgi:hypothetical protein
MKIEPVEGSLHHRHSELEEEDVKPRKKRRVVSVPMVVVPTLEEVKQRWRTSKLKREVETSQVSYKRHRQ